MSEHKIVGELRSSFGKGASRKARAAGKTPAVIYGHGSAPRHITLPAHEIALILRTKNAILDLELAGKSETVMVKAVQRDAVLQIVEHIDLVEIVKGEKVHVEVPVHIVGGSLSAPP
jgi:large subunit ribosomal protein L25